MSETETTEAGSEWDAALAEQAAAADADNAQAGTDESTNGAVQAAAVSDLVDDEVQADPAGLDNILEIPVTLAVEIGSTRVSIRNLLQLNQGSVVELDRLAGEPLNVLVNGTLIAHGEVVVVNEKFGIRLTDVISAQERVRKLQ